MKKITIALISLMFFCNTAIAVNNYIIDNNTVYIDDSNVYLSATPHTLSSSGWVYFNLTSKVYTGNIDVCWGFNTTVSKPTKAEVYNSISHSWKDFSSSINSITHDYEGYNKWYNIKNVPIISNKEYTIRAWVDVPISTEKQFGKYYFAIKPSGETISQAVNNGHFYNLDPWWNATWSTRTEIILTGNTSGAQIDYQILLNISYQSGMQTDFDDLRFCNDTNEIDSWLGSKVDSSYALVYVEFPTTPANGANQTYYMYSGNAEAASDWDIRATMLDGDDFPGVSLDSAIWDTQYCTIGVSGEVLTLSNFAGGDRLTGGVRGKRLIPSTCVIEFKLKNVYASDGVRCGLSNQWSDLADDSEMIYLEYVNNMRIFAWNEGSYSAFVGANWIPDQYYNFKIVANGSSVIGYYDGNIIGSAVTTNIPDENMYLRIIGDASYSPTLQIDWIFARKYASNPPTYAFGSEGYYTDSIHYNTSNPYNNTIDSNSLISVNRSITTSDNIGWTAAALTDDCHLVVTKYNLSDIIIANFTIYTASLNWLTVTGLSPYTNYSLLFANGTLIELQISNDGGVVYFTTNLLPGSYIIEEGEGIHPFSEGAYSFFGEMESGLTDFRDSMGKYLVWGILFFAVGLAFTIFAKIKQTLIGGK